MDLLKCDKCGNRNIMCCVCEKNKQYRETDFSHDIYIRNKAIDDFVEELKDYFVIPHDVRVIEMKAEQLKAGVKNELQQSE